MGADGSSVKFSALGGNGWEGNGFSFDVSSPSVEPAKPVINVTTEDEILSVYQHEDLGFESPVNGKTPVLGTPNGTTEKHQPDSTIDEMVSELGIEV